MPKYFFDVYIGDATEPDAVGSELVSSATVADLALDLCVQVARDRLPDPSDIWVRVRGVDGRTIYESNILLGGRWL